MQSCQTLILAQKTHSGFLPQNYKIINVCCSQSARLWSFLIAAVGNEYMSLPLTLLTKEVNPSTSHHHPPPSSPFRVFDSVGRCWDIVSGSNVSQSHKSNASHITGKHERNGGPVVIESVAHHQQSVRRNRDTRKEH